MIEELRIRDFAIVDSLVIPLSRGFNVITGETGAGKSLIVDALSALLKEKVSAADYVRHGKREASVEVVLSETDQGNDEDVLILRRILSIQGRSRFYINDSASTAQNFTTLASRYINIHGQHEHTNLLRRENHILYLDSIAGLNEDVEQFRALFRSFQNLREEVRRLKEELTLRNQRRELYEYQINEIRSAALRVDEEQELLAKRQILKNALRFKELASKAFELLYEDKNSVLSSLSKISSYLRELADSDSEIKGLLELVDNSVAQLEEVSHLLRKTKEKYEPDPEALERVEERLSLISQLKKKYGETVEKILEYAQKIEGALNTTSELEDELMRKMDELRRTEEELEARAKTLSVRRREASESIVKEIEEELRLLGFSKAKFVIEIADSEITSTGKDSVEFYFSANPGEPPKPLSKVASGGELSRLMLALKCVELRFTKSEVKSMTLVFDEIDAGIGGTVAQNVAFKLKELSSLHQVLSVTHLPQIAALADNHIKVEKQVFEDKTEITARILSDEERKHEIARMLSGVITESSLFHADELLKRR